jgi:glycosyltransferase involved in cell wall biosynthesis
MVSVIVPMLNEAAWIDGCLDSLLSGEYPPARVEVLVVDGGSTDGSRALVEARTERDPRVRLLDNPKRIAAAAMNRGVAEARGDVIVRADAHTTYASDYVAACVRVLERTGAAAVGGPQRAVGSTPVERAIAVATTSRFGVGDARFRLNVGPSAGAGRAEETDTVYLGAWRRDTLLAAGGFDETLPVNEDYELNHRLRAAGGRVVLSPEIRSEYHVRPSLAALARQYFRYGRGKADMLRRHPRSLRWRQAAAPALVAGLAASAVLARRRPGLASTIPLAYVAANLVESVRAGGPLPALPAAYATMHLAWGAGFWAGVLRGGLPRPSLGPSPVTQEAS